MDCMGVGVAVLMTALVWGIRKLARDVYGLK